MEVHKIHVQSIKHVDVLYLLEWIFIFRLIWLFSFVLFCFFLFWLCDKYGYDLKLLNDSSIEESCAKSISVGGLASKTRCLETFLSNKLVVKEPP